MVRRTSNTVHNASRARLKMWRVPCAGVRGVEVNTRRNWIVDWCPDTRECGGNEDVLVHAMGERLTNVSCTSGAAEVELATPEVVGQVEFKLGVSCVRDRSGQLEIGTETRRRTKARWYWPVGEIDT